MIQTSGQSELERRLENERVGRTPLTQSTSLEGLTEGFVSLKFPLIIFRVQQNVAEC